MTAKRRAMLAEGLYPLETAAAETYTGVLSGQQSDGATLFLPHCRLPEPEPGLCVCSCGACGGDPDHPATHCGGSACRAQEALPKEPEPVVRFTPAKPNRRTRRAIAAHTRRQRRRGRH